MHLYGCYFPVMDCNGLNPLAPHRSPSTSVKAPSTHRQKITVLREKMAHLPLIHRLDGGNAECNDLAVANGPIGSVPKPIRFP